MSNTSGETAPKVRGKYNKYELYSKEWADARDEVRKKNNERARAKALAKRLAKAQLPENITMARMKYESKIRAKVKKQAFQLAKPMAHFKAEVGFVAFFIMDYVARKIAKWKKGDDDATIAYAIDKAVAKYNEQQEAKHTIYIPCDF